MVQRETTGAGRQEPARQAGDLGAPRQETRPSLTLKKRIKAPAARVYRAWTEPDLMLRWFSPHECVVESAEAEVRVGGRFRVVMREIEGERERHEVSGTYIEVEPDARLVFSWAWVTMPERESLVTVTLKPVAGDSGEECVLTLLHERFVDEEARDGHRHGWTGALERLEALFG